MTFLFDTNVCVRFIRDQGARTSLLVQRVSARRSHEIALCSVVLGELFYGCARSAKSAANRSSVLKFVRPYQSLPFDDGAAAIYGQLRHSLERAGTPIGPYDLQIASVALDHGLILVTHNVSEFSRVPGLVVEDWEIP